MPDDTQPYRTELSNANKRASKPPSSLIIFNATYDINNLFASSPPRRTPRPTATLARANGAPPRRPASTTCCGTAASLAATDSAHPLEARLKQWEATRAALRMETLRRAFGMAEPVRRGMELKITREGEWRPLVLGGGGSSSSQQPSVHEDILLGRDATVDWEDIYTGEELRAVPGFHEEMERKLRM
ncbi:20S proteasome maturation protein [Niveomyces insectorum RCEF 264]|uniref:20S proteasome maturation protein n=1 Tax=Niveomyces insectorum RCEF 264 TaxID=1081102 RepID=A0A162JFU9_9HYPO|nr:20S proteasome maturation protein [Niveomyces insectorum RCEF 264]